MKRIEQSFSITFNYDVVFTKNLFSPENEIFASSLLEINPEYPSKLFFVIDSGITKENPAYVNEIETYINLNPTSFSLISAPMIVQGGEEVKHDMEAVLKLLNHINEFRIDRHAYIIAIGGGAVLDMVGFVAAIAHRGIRHIRIPSTVLSQNDSGIGVKNGINYFRKKNFVGSFAPPELVFNDSNLLKTLDARDWRSGISEAIKVALIKDSSFFEWLEKNAQKLNDRDLPTMEELIYQCSSLHLDHIATSGDPFEKGASRPLDFGHWSAHKLEQMTDYKIRHGEAVAWGIALDTTYSYLKGMLSFEDMDRVIRLIENLNLNFFDPQHEYLGLNNFNSQLLVGLEEFREHLGGQLTIMLLNRIGTGVEVYDMDHEIIVEAINLLTERRTSHADQA